MLRGGALLLRLRRGGGGGGGGSGALQREQVRRWAMAQQQLSTEATEAEGGEEDGAGDAAAAPRKLKPVVPVTPAQYAESKFRYDQELRELRKEWWVTSRWQARKEQRAQNRKRETIRLRKAQRMRRRRSQQVTAEAAEAERRKQREEEREEYLRRHAMWREEKQREATGRAHNMLEKLEEESHNWITMDNVDQKIQDSLWERPSHTGVLSSMSKDMVFRPAVPSLRRPVSPEDGEDGDIKVGPVERHMLLHGTVSQYEHEQARELLRPLLQGGKDLARLDEYADHLVESNQSHLIKSGRNAMEHSEHRELMEMILKAQGRYSEALTKKDVDLLRRLGHDTQEVYGLAKEYTSNAQQNRRSKALNDEAAYLDEVEELVLVLAKRAGVVLDPHSNASIADRLKRNEESITEAGRRAQERQDAGEVGAEDDYELPHPGSWEARGGLGVGDEPPDYNPGVHEPNLDQLRNLVDKGTVPGDGDLEGLRWCLFWVRAQRDFRGVMLQASAERTRAERQKMDETDRHAEEFLFGNLRRTVRVMEKLMTTLSQTLASAGKSLWRSKDKMDISFLPTSTDLDDEMPVLLLQHMVAAGHRFRRDPSDPLGGAVGVYMKALGLSDDAVKNFLASLSPQQREQIIHETFAIAAANVAASRIAGLACVKMGKDFRDTIQQCFGGPLPLYRETAFAQADGEVMHTIASLTPPDYNGRDPFRTHTGEEGAFDVYYRAAAAGEDVAADDDVDAGVSAAQAVPVAEAEAPAPVDDSEAAEEDGDQSAEEAATTASSDASTEEEAPQSKGWLSSLFSPLTDSGKASTDAAKADPEGLKEAQDALGLDSSKGSVDGVIALDQEGFEKEVEEAKARMGMGREDEAPGDDALEGDDDDDELEEDDEDGAEEEDPLLAKLTQRFAQWEADGMVAEDPNPENHSLVEGVDMDPGNDPFGMAQQQRENAEAVQDRLSQQLGVQSGETVVAQVPREDFEKYQDAETARLQHQLELLTPENVFGTGERHQVMMTQIQRDTVLRNMGCTLLELEEQFKSGGANKQSQDGDQSVDLAPVFRKLVEGFALTHVDKSDLVVPEPAPHDQWDHKAMLQKLETMTPEEQQALFDDPAEANEGFKANFRLTGFYRAADKLNARILQERPELRAKVPKRLERARRAPTRVELLEPYAAFLSPSERAAMQFLDELDAARLARRRQRQQQRRRERRRAEQSQRQSQA